MSQEAADPEREQLTSWLASNRAPLHLCWSLLCATDLLVLRGVSKEVAATANRYLADIPHQLRLLRTVTNVEKSPAGSNTWASIKCDFCDCNGYGVNPDGSTSIRPCGCGGGDGVGGCSAAPTVPAAVERTACITWALEIAESEVTSDTEDSDYDPFEQGAQWDQTYRGEHVALCTAEELSDCGESGPALLTADSSSTFFFGPAFKFIVGTRRDSSKRIGVFRRKVEQAPKALPSRLEACRATGAVSLKVLVPLAAGGCNDGTCGPKWLALIPSLAETDELSDSS